MAKHHDIYDRVLNFACRIKKMERALAGDRRVDGNAMRQLVSSSSSIGSNLNEAGGAQSRADFHAKLRISLKEARETHYWLRWFLGSESIDAPLIAPLIDEANQIVAILTTIAKKTNPRNPAPPAAPS